MRVRVAEATWRNRQKEVMVLRQREVAVAGLQGVAEVTFQDQMVLARAMARRLWGNLRLVELGQWWELGELKMRSEHGYLGN